jgi:regulator of sigma D
MDRKKERDVPIGPIVFREVSDLGAGAYLLMYGWKVVGRRGKSIIFEVEESAINDFEQDTLDYLSSDFHRFDSCLMSLKKINEYMPEKK